MKLILSLGIFLFAASFCGISDRLQNITGTDEPDGISDTSSPTTEGVPVETAVLTEEQKAIQNSGEEISWTEQGISWKLPDGWKKMDEKKEMLNYGSPDGAFLIGTISVMGDNFPAEISLRATYDSSMQQLKNGKYELARFLEIDGIKGVEFIEAVPEDADGIRRHQWIAFRNYQGQNQQLNIMLTTARSRWEKHSDEFPAIMYSMKIAK